MRLLKYWCAFGSWVWGREGCRVPFGLGFSDGGDEGGEACKAPRVGYETRLTWSEITKVTI